jgi:hypothetical protein
VGEDELPQWAQDAYGPWLPAWVTYGPWREVGDAFYAEACTIHLNAGIWEGSETSFTARTIVHEMGHCLGLEDLKEGDYIMNHLIRTPMWPTDEEIRKAQDLYTIASTP